MLLLLLLRTNKETKWARATCAPLAEKREKHRRVDLSHSAFGPHGVRHRYKFQFNDLREHAFYSGDERSTRSTTHLRRDLRQVVETHPVAPAHVVDDARVSRVETPHERHKRRVFLLGFGHEPPPVIVDSPVLLLTWSGAQIRDVRS